MTEEEHEEILRIVRQLKESPAMNGDFTKLVSSVEHIRTTQSGMCTDINVVMVKQEEAKVVVDEMHVALYHPDNGIYKRINDSVAQDQSQGTSSCNHRPVFSRNPSFHLGIPRGL